MNILLLLRFHGAKIFFGCHFALGGFVGYLLWQPDPPGLMYSSLVGMIGPYPLLAIGIFGLLMIMHAIVVETIARRRLQAGIHEENMQM